MRLQFIARVGKYTAFTKIPIVVVKAGTRSSLQEVPSPSVPQKRSREGEFREIQDDVSDIGALETKRSDARTSPVSACELGSSDKLLQQKFDLEPTHEQACSSDENSTGQSLINETRSRTRQSSELDYALAKQLCSLQTQVRSFYK